MAVNLTLCNIIAYFFAVISALSTLGSCFLLKRALDHHGHPMKNTDGSITVVSAWNVTFQAITLVVCFAVFVSSVFLIIGIKNKRLLYVSQWVFTMPLCIVLSLLKLLDDSRGALATNLVSVVLLAACWYPIFNLFREMRTPRNSHNIGYNACPANMQHGGSPHGVYVPQTQPAYPAKH